MWLSFSREASLSLLFSFSLWRLTHGKLCSVRMEGWRAYCVTYCSWTHSLNLMVDSLNGWDTLLHRSSILVYRNERARRMSLYFKTTTWFRGEQFVLWLIGGCLTVHAWASCWRTTGGWRSIWTQNLPSCAKTDWMEPDLSRELFWKNSWWIGEIKDSFHAAGPLGTEAKCCFSLLFLKNDQRRKWTTDSQNSLVLSCGWWARQRMLVSTKCWA